MHYNPNYTETELDHLENMLLSPNEASIGLALELIKNNGIHERLERPLALLFSMDLDMSYSLTEQLAKLFKSRIDTVRRAELKKELAIFMEVIEEEDYDTISAFIDIFIKYYAKYMQGRQHLLMSFYEVASDLRNATKSKTALRCYLAAIEWGTTHQNTYFELGLLYQNDLEMLPEARDAYLEALQLDRQDYVAHNNLGQVYEALDDIESAEKHLLAALAILPTYVHSIINLAYIRWRHQSRYEEAYRLYEQSLQIERYDTYALCNFAELLMLHFQEYERAKQYLQESLDVDEEDNEAWRILGNLALLESPPNKKAAKACYLKALEFSPDNESIINKLSQLDDE